MFNYYKNDFSLAFSNLIEYLIDGNKKLVGIFIMVYRCKTYINMNMKLL